LSFFIVYKFAFFFGFYDQIVLSCTVLLNKCFFSIWQCCQTQYLIIFSERQKKRLYSGNFSKFVLLQKQAIMKIFRLQLHWQILIALLFSIGFGYFFPKQVDYVGWMGTIFLRALNMVVVPLILSSIISGVTSIGSGSNLGRLGVKTLSFYVFTSFLAIVTGLFLVNLVQPGVGANLNLSNTNRKLRDGMP
jgi:hypothetical protein